jgi:tripartite-type tricarboxylate transporter receptor subunit TctC
MMTGIDMLHVPYRGGAPAIADLLGGQVQVMFEFLPSSIEFVRAGRLRALAVTTATRVEFLPDIPPVADFVPGFEAAIWLGIGAPKNTPTQMSDKLNREINAALGDPRIRARIADLGSITFPRSAADLAQLIAAETEKWVKVIRTANIKL